jgi:hypothetical protein
VVLGSRSPTLMVMGGILLVSRVRAVIMMSVSRDRDAAYVVQRRADFKRAGAPSSR